MPDIQKQIESGYALAKEQYAAYGVDVEQSPEMPRKSTCFLALLARR